MRFLKKHSAEILVLILFVLIRLPSLGNDTFNTDVWKWKTRSYDFGTGVFTGDFAKTNQKYHPGVTLMWVGTVAIKAFNLYADFANLPIESINATFCLHTTQKVFLVFALGFGVVSIFKALRALFGEAYAWISIVLIMLEPFYLALTRVFHLEGLLSTFMLASVLWLYCYLKDNKQKKLLVLSALFGGLSLLTKTSAVYLFPFVALALFVWQYLFLPRRDRDILQIVNSYLIWIGIACGIFFALWPALWVNLGSVLTNLYRGISVIGVERNHYQYYFGDYVSDPGPLYYFVVLLIRSSVYLLVGLGGLLAARKKVLNKDKGLFVLYLFLYSFFYVVQHTLPAKKLDRYVLPALIGLLPVGALFFHYVFEKVTLAPIKKIFLGLSLSAITILYLHPDYLSYYNPLTGGLRTGIFMVEPKWLIGQKQIVRYFEEVIRREQIPGVSECTSLECVITADKTASALTVAFPEKYYTQVHPFFTRMGAWAVIKDLTPFAKHTKYFVYPVWSDDSYKEDRFKISYMDSIKIRGVTVYNVYKAN
jgi:hypothetical protein